MKLTFRNPSKFNKGKNQRLNQGSSQIHFLQLSFIAARKAGAARFLLDEVQTDTISSYAGTIAIFLWQTFTSLS